MALTSLTRAPRTEPRGHVPKRRFSGWHFVLAPIALLFMIPFAQMLLASVSPAAELVKFPPPFIPSPGLKMSSHAARRPLRMTGLEDAKLLMSILSKFQFSKRSLLSAGGTSPNPSSAVAMGGLGSVSRTMLGLPVSCVMSACSRFH